MISLDHPMLCIYVVTVVSHIPYFGLHCLLSIYKNKNIF